MNCEEAESLLGQLVFDDLEDDRKEPLRQHVEQCDACRELAGDMKVAAKLLKDGVELETPVLSDDARASLLNRAVSRRSPVWGRLSTGVKVVSIAAALFLVLGVLASGTFALRMAKPQLMQTIGRYDDDTPSVSRTEPHRVARPASPTARPQDYAKESSGAEALDERAARDLEAPGDAEVIRKRLVPPRERKAKRQLDKSSERRLDLTSQESEHPTFVYEEVEISDRMETDNYADSSSVRAQEDAITDIPLGGTAVVGNIGMGIAASPQPQEAPRRANRLAREKKEEQQIAGVGYDGLLTLEADAPSDPSSSPAPETAASVPMSRALYGEPEPMPSVSEGGGVAGKADRETLPVQIVASYNGPDVHERGIVAPDVPRDFDRVESTRTQPAPPSDDVWMSTPQMGKVVAQQPVKKPQLRFENSVEQMHALRSKDADDADDAKSRLADLAKLHARLDEAAPTSGARPKPSR